MFPIISLGPLSLPAPAFILIIGYLAGSFLLDKKASSFSIDSEIIDRALWIGTITALLGARLSYIAGSPAAFKGNLISIISLNPALLDPVGGLVIGIAAIFFVISKHNIDYWAFLDSLTPFLSSIFPAYFFSRFAAGDGYGLITDLPWGIYLWGATRHPVQLYLAAFSLIPLIIILLYAPFKNLPSGGTFLLFSIATSGYILFFTAFQEPRSTLISGFRIAQIISWLFLLSTILLLNYRVRSSPNKEKNEGKE